MCLGLLHDVVRTSYLQLQYSFASILLYMCVWGKEGGEGGEIYIYIFNADTGNWP